MANGLWPTAYGLRPMHKPIAYGLRPTAYGLWPMADRRWPSIPKQQSAIVAPLYAGFKQTRFTFVCREQLR